jgi:hypothetical protein
MLHVWNTIMNKVTVAVAGNQQVLLLLNWWNESPACLILPCMHAMHNPALEYSGTVYIHLHHHRFALVPHHCLHRQLPYKTFTPRLLRNSLVLDFSSFDADRIRSTSNISHLIKEMFCVDTF